MSVHNISAEIAKRLTAIKNENGTVTIDDVSGLLENVANVISPGSSAVEVFLRDEITRIASHIQVTKQEILALTPSDTASAEHIGTAAIQLDAVVKATEEAAHNIMDAADEIQNTMNSCTDEKLKQQIADITGRIYEACNFQDLTGQRIKKVMHALDYTESRIQRLIKLFSSDGTIHPEDLAKARALSPEDELLNGPQLPGEAPSQADIDAMFNNVK